MREYIVQYERKETDNPKDKCDLCNHAIVGEVVRCKDCVRNNDGNLCDIAYFINTDGDGFCNCGERREE